MVPSASDCIVGYALAYQCAPQLCADVARHQAFIDIIGGAESRVCFVWEAKNMKTTLTKISVTDEDGFKKWNALNKSIVKLHLAYASPVYEQFDLVTELLDDEPRAGGSSAPPLSEKEFGSKLKDLGFLSKPLSKTKLKNSHAVAYTGRYLDRMDTTSTLPFVRNTNHWTVMVPSASDCIVGYALAYQCAPQLCADVARHQAFIDIIGGAESRVCFVWEAKNMKTTLTKISVTDEDGFKKWNALNKSIVKLHFVPDYYVKVTYDPPRVRSTGFKKYEFPFWIFKPNRECLYVLGRWTCSHITGELCCPRDSFDISAHNLRICGGPWKEFGILPTHISEAKAMALVKSMTPARQRSLPVEIRHVL